MRVKTVGGMGALRAFVLTWGTATLNVRANGDFAPVLGERDRSDDGFALYEHAA